MGSDIKHLKNLLAYQQNSIVSQVLMKNPGGNITLFAFGAGEGLSPHTAPYDAFVLAVDGAAQIEIDGEKFQLHEGESIILPANRSHAVQAEKDFKMLLVMIKA